NRVDENTEFGEGYNPIEKATPEDVEEAIDNLEIGGRNLLLGTSDKETIFNFSGYNGNTYYVSDEAFKEMIKGGRYTARVVITEFTEGETDVGFILQYLKNGSYVTQETIPSDKWIGVGESGEIVHTFNLTDKSDLDVNQIVIRIRNRISSNQNSKGKFKELKLEKGNKATDWTPAPEDQ